MKLVAVLRGLKACVEAGVARRKNRVKNKRYERVVFWKKGMEILVFMVALNTLPPKLFMHKNSDHKTMATL